MRHAPIALLLTVIACTASVTTPSPTPTTSPVLAPISGSPLPDSPQPSPSMGALPQGAGEVAVTSAPVPSAPPPGKATPTPDPAVWRFEGRVVDPDGKPLRDVCVVIGPHGCQRGSPRTDERGVYFIDLPQVPTVIYDFYFVSDGYTVVWHRMQPAEPTVFNVVLRKPQSRMDRSDG